MGYFGYRPYVPVARRRQKALRKMEKLKKKGVVIQPIQIERRKIATTFWGKAWCCHIESFSDYENRLPRGKTYVRNGSVCHLVIEEGLITAIVSGSELYNVKIKVNALSAKKWQAIKKKCRGKVSSLLELLSGQLSDEVMEVVCDRRAGLFPRADEIDLSCDCPDWADMCKHIAAVLYGVSIRLDLEPEQLFKLRGVDHGELVDVKALVASATQAKSRRRKLDKSDLSEVFAIDLPDEQQHKLKNINTQGKNIKKSGKTDKKDRKLIVNKEVLKMLTGAKIRNKRNSLKLSKRNFAEQLGVSSSTISQWESKGRKKLVLKKSSLIAVQKLICAENNR